MTEEVSCSDNDDWVVVVENALVAVGNAQVVVAGNAQVVVESKLVVVAGNALVVAGTCTCSDA